MKRLITLFSLLMIVLCMGLAPVNAQSPEWEAWVYNSDNGRMILIGSDNVVYDDFTLPGLQNNSYSWQAIVSPDGQIIAYTLNNMQTQVQTVNIYSTVSDSIVASYMIPSQQGQYVANSIELLSTSQAFTPDSQQFAFSYSIDQEWSIIVMDVGNQAGTILLQVNSTDPTMSAVPQVAFDLPTIVRFDGTIIDFDLIQVATEGLPTYPHFTYDITTGIVTQNYYLTVPGGDFSDSTGLYAFPISDYRLPNSQDTYSGFGQHINALHVWLPSTVETYPIFNAPERSVSRPRFIQNSEKILINAYDWVSGEQEYWVIEPNNTTPTVLTTLRNVYPSGIEGTGNGFLITINVNDVVNVFPEFANLSNRTGLLSFDTRVATDGTSVKQVWFSEENANYKLVWARDNQLASRPTPPAWIPIGEAITAANYDTLTQSATANNPSVGTLQVGGQARIFTTDGDRANMRSGAGTNFEVVEQLSNDTIVTVLEGPVSGNNFVWWRIQTASNTGWVVESAEGVRVLQPIANSSSQAVEPAPPAGSFQIGDRVIITEAGNNLNARQQPSTSASVVLVLRTNQIFPISGGPVTADGFTWWFINTASGPAWIAEGTDTEKWILNAHG